MTVDPATHLLCSVNRSTFAIHSLEAASKTEVTTPA